MSVELKPGDVFYFPAGMWHKVEALEPGVSINVSLMASNYATVACQALQQVLYKDERWREPILNNSNQNAVEHLKKLLKDLPSMIQTLESNGAESIIPPILEHPPSFQTIMEEAEEQEELDASYQSEEEENEEQEHSSDEGDGSGEDGGESTGADISGDYMEDIINPLEFDDYPSEWIVNFKADSKVCFSRNPLAALHRLSEITSFYDKTQGSCHDTIYVLNINYAGNEMHQSVIRVVFRDSVTNFAGRLYDWEREANDKLLDTLISEADFPLAKFLVFHGYLHVARHSAAIGAHEN